MSQDNEVRTSKVSSSRYSLPAWFLERNVKTALDLKEIETQFPICQCETCVKCKNNYDDIDSEDESSNSEPTSHDSKPEDEPHTSAEKHEISHEDAISYAKFSELRDTVATSMLWRHMRPQDSGVLLRRCSVMSCTTCPMDPVFMNDMVVQVAKSLEMDLISLSYEDLEELGCEFHTQDKQHADRRSEEQKAEKKSEEKSKETSSTPATAGGEGTATENNTDRCAEKDNNVASEASAATSTKPVKDDWKADWSDALTFTQRFFAARSKKWEDDATFSYSAWRDRARESNTAILDGVSVKAGQTSKPKEDCQAEEGIIPSSRGCLLHFIDCDYSVKPLDYRQCRRIWVRLAELVQERRAKGDDIVMVVSSNTVEAVDKLCQKTGISTFSNVTLSIVNPSQKKAEARDLRRKGNLNARRLRWILNVGATHPARAQAKIEWSPSVTGEDVEQYGKEMWPVNDVHRAAGQILGRTWMKAQPVITSKHVDSVLRRLGLLTTPKATEKKDENSNSDAAEVNSDEKVEEVEQNPLDNIVLDDYEERFRDCVIKPKDLNVSWDDVILDQDTKEVIQNLVPSSKIEVEASSEFLLSQLRIRGCLLYGPPGTGKTHLCRAIAASSGSRMLSIDYATTQAYYVGEAEKYIRAAFSLAAKLHPCVLLIDEADALFYRRSSSSTSWERSATTQFLVEMEGLAKRPDAPLVVVATNRPWDLDEAFLRRLPQKFYIGLPDQDSRAAILRTFLKDDDLDPAVDIDGMARATKGFSGSDLRSLCAEAALVWKMEQGRLDALCGAVSPAFATSRTAAPRRLRLDVDHFAAAFEKMQPSNARETSEELERFSRRYNPVQGELGLGNGGKRYVFDEESRMNEAVSVRELISRPVPPQEDTPVNMQLVVWRDPNEVLCPGRVRKGASETPSLTLVTTYEEVKSSEAITESCAGERLEHQENSTAEPKAQSVEVVPYSELDIAKAHPTPDHQDLCAEDMPSTTDARISESERPESTGPDSSRAGVPAPEPQKLKSGADVDLLPLLVTLASVFWYENGAAAFS